MNVQQRVVPNVNSQIYKQNAAKFFGEEFKDDVSQGSLYERNKANFFGTDTKKDAFKIESKTGGPVQPEVNMKSGVFKKNATMFYGGDKYSET